MIGCLYNREVALVGAKESHLRPGFRLLDGLKPLNKPRREEFILRLSVQYLIDRT